MEHNIYLMDLFDYYSELLTDKQRITFTDYYFNNLTLSEISENNQVSRNAVHKQVKDVEEKLLTFESKLKLYEKKNKIISILAGKDKEIIEKIKEYI